MAFWMALIFSVNLKTALDALPASADSEDNAVSVEEALEFFVFGKAKKLAGPKGKEVSVGTKDLLRIAADRSTRNRVEFPAPPAAPNLRWNLDSAVFPRVLRLSQRGTGIAQLASSIQKSVVCRHQCSGI